MSDRLERLEAAVLDMLLQGDHPVLHALRKQVPGLTVGHRERTATGFFAELRPRETAVPAPIPTGKGQLDDVMARIPGLDRGAGFVLFVEGGLLAVLEGFAHDDEPWPARVGDFTLEYRSADRTAALANIEVPLRGG
jgi:hypothetical protein